MRLTIFILFLLIQQPGDICQNNYINVYTYENSFINISHSSNYNCSSLWYHRYC